MKALPCLTFACIGKWEGFRGLRYLTEYLVKIHPYQVGTWLKLTAKLENPLVLASCT